MHQEFKFVSCKWASSDKDLSPDEIELWFFLMRNYLECKVDSPSEFFEHDDYATDAICIMRWKWKDHEILDMNGYPRDNECGTIAFDGKPLIYNGDGDLAFIDDDKTQGFEDRLGYFINLRISLMNGEIIEDDDGEVDKFLTPEVWELYRKGCC